MHAKHPNKYLTEKHAKRALLKFRLSKACPYNLAGLINICFIDKA